MGAESSITSSRGKNLELETTSLTVMAWLDLDPSFYSTNIELSIEYLLKSVKDGGRYGSTQATVLVLKTLVKYAKIYGGLKGSGSFVLYMDNSPVKSIDFSESNPMTNIDFSLALNNAYSQKYLKNLVSSSASAGSSVELKIKLENYSYNTEKKGFRLSSLITVDFTNKAPRSVSNPPISFQIWYDRGLSSILKDIGSL